MQHHNYSLGDIEGLIPWEREIYVQLLIDHIKQENESWVQQNKQLQSTEAETDFKVLQD